MKWDAKHDRAKRIIDTFLDNAGYWQEREDLAENLTDEEKELVSQEVALMIESIRKRYKLQERLSEVPATDSVPEVKQEEPPKEKEEEPDEEQPKPKRARKPRAKKKEEVA